MKKSTRFLSLLLVLLMILAVFPVSAFAADTIPDGTYTKSGRVNFSKDKYTFNVTLTVSGGKITDVSVLRSNTDADGNAVTTNAATMTIG